MSSSNIKLQDAEKNKVCTCQREQAVYKLIFLGGVLGRTRNIYLCESCKRKLTDILFPM